MTDFETVPGGFPDVSTYQFLATSCSFSRENTASFFMTLCTFSSSFLEGCIRLCMKRLKISKPEPLLKQFLNSGTQDPGVFLCVEGEVPDKFRIDGIK
jgi:hypothetical protein